MEYLFSSGQCSEDEYKLFGEELDTVEDAALSNIISYIDMLDRPIFKKITPKKKPCVYGRSKNIPFNHSQSESVFHHMHLMLPGGTHRNVGIYIPKTLHRSIPHSSITGKGMKQINKAALLWLCEQSII